MSLLSDAEKLEIRAAVKSATDTFMVTPVIVYTWTQVLDRFAEGETDTAVPHALNALAEVKGGAEMNKLIPMVDGSIDFKDIKLTFNLQDVNAAGLFDNVNKKLNIEIEKDFFTTRGRKYKITDAYTEGPLDETDLLVIIWGKFNDSVNGI